MKRKREEFQSSSELSRAIEILWRTRENDTITRAFVYSLQRLLDTDKTLIELLTSDNIIQTLASISSAALSALLLALMKTMTGHEEKYHLITNVQLSFLETLSPYRTTHTSTLNNSLSVLNFIQKILCLRYNLSNNTSDVLQMWLCGSCINEPNKTTSYHPTCKNQVWIPRIAFMIAYSCLLNRIQVMKKSFKSEEKLNKAEVLCILKKDDVIDSSILLLSYSTMISRMMYVNEQEDAMRDFQKHINHVNDLVNAMQVASEPKSCADYEISPKSNTAPSKTVFETLCEEVQNCKDLENTINELNDNDEKLGVNHDSEYETLNDPVEADLETDAVEYENAAIELLPTLAEIPTTTREVDFVTCKLTSILHEAGEVDGVEGIRKVAMVFKGKEKSIKYSDELLSSLCKSCITEEISAVRAMTLMEAFILPSILRIGRNDASAPPSRLLATTVSGLLKLRPLETVTSLFVPTINQTDDQNDQLPNKMQLDFINRTIKSVQLSSESANTLLSPLSSIIWSEEPIILLHTVLKKISDDKLANDMKSILVNKIVLTSKDVKYIKSAKFASLFQTFVKRFGSTLLPSDVQSLLEACSNLKSLTAKSISTALRKLA